jgi:sortase A
MRPAGARLLCLALAAGGIAFLGAGGRLQAKALLAQVLLRRAWAETRASGGPVKPWPWADTWPVARLSVPARGVDLVVLADASGRSMAFGPGYVAGSAPPGAGRTVVSGHRDTHFRFLQALAPADVVRLETPDGRRHAYAVTDAVVVHARDPAAAWDPGGGGLALVTCFPFDAVAPGGPLRYVVRAAPARLRD